MTYRGVLRTFSNRYHFNGGVPADTAHWTTFSDAVTLSEKLIYTALASGGAKIVETFGYEAGSEIPVFSKTYAIDGVGTAVGVIPPGDSAAIVRYSTASRSSKNHPIYMFSYYHCQPVIGGATGMDTLHATTVSVQNAYATAWDSTGFSDGTHTFKRTSPAGHDATGHVVLPLISHRDLPR